MSLFEDDAYLYRDTFFVYFKDENRPTTQAVAECFEKLGASTTWARSERLTGGLVLSR